MKVQWPGEVRMDAGRFQHEECVSHLYVVFVRRNEARRHRVTRGREKDFRRKTIQQRETQREWGRETQKKRERDIHTQKENDRKSVPEREY